MPNDCDNVLTVVGPIDEALTFFTRACGSSGELVQDVVQATLGDSESAPVLHRKLLDRVMLESFSFRGHVPEPPDDEPDDDTADDEDWRVEHWGTKWDAVDPELFEAPSPDQLRVRFFTAWSPPEEWLKRVAAVHPKLRFELAFCEPGVQALGVLIAGPDGVWLEDEFTPGGSDDPTRFERYLGYDPSNMFPLPGV